MKRLFSIFVLAVIAFAACTTDVTEDVAVKLPETLTVSFEESSRIQLNEEQKTVWTTGDLVSVFYRSDANQQWKFNGQTGATTAELTKVVEPEATNTLSKVVTIYPYNENYTIDAECKVTATLPAEQEYLADSFGIGSSIMIAESESNNAQLRNAMGWLRLHLTGDGEVVKSITVKGNNSEQVAGQITINPSDATITLAESSTATTVTLNCTDGVTLGSEATAFYIALPPQKFEGGITAEISCNDGSKMVKSTSNSVTIKRNTILPMEEFNYQENTRIYYTATEKIVPNNTDVFGANIVSNEWDETTGEGIITFDAPVTTIGSSAFRNRNNLASVTIPNSVTEIGGSAFYNCSNLTSVTIPSSVTEIGSSAFSRCSRLKNVYYQGDLSGWCKISFRYGQANPLSNWAKLYIDNKEVTDITIPSDITSIGDYTFICCSSLTSVTIPDSVTKIRSGAFSDCSSLASITIGNRVTMIGTCTFSSCSSLTSVTIGNRVTEIGDRAFKGCSKLTSVTIPDSVTEIGPSAFEKCSSLTSVTIPDSVTTLGTNPFRSCSKLTEFNGKFASADKRCLIVDGVLNAFAPTGLTEYTIPDSVTTIGDSAFESCRSLTSVTIGNRVTEIGDWAFAYCRSLTSVTIPNSVTAIRGYAFNGCSSLKSVYCKPTTPPQGGSSMFSDNATDRKIYVPASDDDSIINAYKAADYWNDYADYIEEYDFTE